MTNWQRPSNRSASVLLPSGASKTYSFSTFTHGSSRRSALSLSRNRVSSFSLTRCCLRAALPLWEQAQAATERLVTESSPDRLRADLRALS
jgi:hypothetical protein